MFFHFQKISHPKEIHQVTELEVSLKNSPAHLVLN